MRFELKTGNSLNDPPLRARRNRALNLAAHGHGQLRLSLEMRLQQPRGALLVAVERRFHDRFVLAVGGDRALGIFPEVAAIALAFLASSCPLWVQKLTSWE